MHFQKQKLLYLIDSAFILSLVFIAVFWVLETITLHVFSFEIILTFRLRYFAIPLLLLTARAILRKDSGFTGLSRCSPLEFPVIRGAVLIMASIILFVGLLEKALAYTRYDVEMPPIIFELTDAKGLTEQNQGYADPELIFAFRKGEIYHGVKINSLGYREREVEPQKQPGTMRVICMGDSVTAQGDPGYCGILHALLNADPPTPQAWEAFNMAVYGYSSVQGLRVFQLQTKNLEPDIVTLYYGWNDHWPAMRKDRDRMARRTSNLYGYIYEIFRDKLTFMLLHNLIIHGDAGSNPRDEPCFRVPPEEYMDTLRRFVAEIRDVGATPLLITAPRRNALPSLKKFGKLDIDYNRVHDEYAEYTRQVARELKVDLLDLHQEFFASEYDAYFSNDGIHFQQEGLERIAGALNQEIQRIMSAKLNEMDQ
ncbi:MAG TPA: hypothetical protein ENN39_05430 [Desulfonatronum sp.]|nr:hypothetical protein [Desulfonatronum sp.]